MDTSASSSIFIVSVLLMLCLSSDFFVTGEIDVDGHMAPSPRRHAMDARHETNHIKEHLDHVATTDLKDMTSEELEFHYFKLHDYDDDNKLDGIEIGKALTHFDRNEVVPEDTEPLMTDSQLAELIDSVLQDEDADKDGYVNYAEFVAAQKRESHTGGNHADSDGDPSPSETPHHEDEKL